MNRYAAFRGVVEDGVVNRGGTTVLREEGGVDVEAAIGQGVD